MVAVPLLLSFLNDRLGLPRFWFGKTFGQFLVLVGIIVLADCFRVIKKFGEGTPVPVEPPKHLVTKGLFQFTRNPMYIALFAIILGEAFFLGHLLLFIYFLLLDFLFHLYVVKIEEPEVKRRFGKEYEEYCQKTPRWLFKKSIPEVVSSFRILFRKMLPKKTSPNS